MLKKSLDEFAPDVAAMARRSAKCERRIGRDESSRRLETLDHFLSKSLNYSTCSLSLAGASLGALSSHAPAMAAFSLRS